MTLDEQLRALCEEHDLCCLHVGDGRYNHGTEPYVMVQAFVDKTKPDESGNRHCVFGVAGPTGQIKFALMDAIEKLNALRVRMPIVPDLEAAL